NDLGLVDFYVEGIRSELTALDVTDNRISEKLDKIIRSARRVLDFSGELKQKLTKSGKAMAEEPCVIKPQQLFEEALDYFQDKLSTYPTIRVLLDVDHDVGYVQVIRSLITDTLLNLISNAIDAMPEGGTLFLHTRNIDRSVALDVTDTGVGIPEQVQAQIFE